MESAILLSNGTPIAELERSDRPANYARYLLASLEILQAARQTFRSLLLKKLSNAVQHRKKRRLARDVRTDAARSAL